MFYIFTNFRLHDKVDIQECICKNRKYCHAGQSRSLDYTDHDVESDNETLNDEFMIKKSNEKVERHTLNYSSSLPMYNIYLIICFILLIFIRI